MKIKVVGDPANQKRFSSKIIIDSLNGVLKEMDFYSDSGKVIVYDGCCNSHGYNPDAFICTYEIDFPAPILKNAGQRPILGVSKDNHSFIINGGHPASLSSWFPLGVDTTLYPRVTKSQNLDKFVVGVYTESLVRGGIELCLEAFLTAFKGSRACRLKIKDRNGTPEFEKYVSAFRDRYMLDVEYETAHFETIDKITEWFSGVDCHLYMNRSSTWAMPPCESMAMGVPTIVVPYAGPKEYIFHGQTGLEIYFTREYVNNSLLELIKIGCRNFFFSYGYKNEPKWAVGSINSAADNLLLIAENKDIKEQISENGRKYARENLTWEKSAAILVKEMGQWY